MSINIIVGSQMGSAEYVADQIHEHLNDLNITNSLFEQPDENTLDQPCTTWIICTSTHGAGELPDNIKDFYESIESSDDLVAKNYAVIGLGDSSYDRFNQAAKDFDSLLTKKGLTQLAAPLEIDAQQQELPEDIAIEWLPTLIGKLTN